MQQLQYSFSPGSVKCLTGTECDVVLTPCIVLQIFYTKMPNLVWTNTPEGPLGTYITVSQKPSQDNATLAADLFW